MGEFVDNDGNPVSDSGDYVVDFKPFLDDNGNPVIPEVEKNEKQNEEDNKESAKDDTTQETVNTTPEPTNQ